MRPTNAGGAVGVRAGSARGTGLVREQGDDERRLLLGIQSKGAAGGRDADVAAEADESGGGELSAAQKSSVSGPINAGDKAAGIGIAQMRILHFRGLEKTRQD